VGRLRPRSVLGQLQAKSERLFSVILVTHTKSYIETTDQRDYGGKPLKWRWGRVLAWKIPEFCSVGGAISKKKQHLSRSSRYQPTGNSFTPNQWYWWKADTLKVCLLLVWRVCDQAFGIGRYRPLKGAESGHVIITKIENLHIDTRRKFTGSKNAILFDRFRTVASPGACGRLAVLNSWRSSSIHPSSCFYYLLTGRIHDVQRPVSTALLPLHCYPTCTQSLEDLPQSTPTTFNTHGLIDVHSHQVHTSRWWSSRTPTALTHPRCNTLKCGWKFNLTCCEARSGAATICPRPLQVMTWTITQSFQLGGHHACRWCGSSYFICVSVWSS